MIKRAILRGFAAAGYSIARTTAFEAKVRETDTWAAAKQREIEEKIAKTQAWVCAKEQEIKDKVSQTQAWAAAKEQDVEEKIAKTRAWASAKEQEIEDKVSQTQTWAAAKEQEVVEKIAQTRAWAAAKENDIDQREASLAAREREIGAELVPTRILATTAKPSPARPALPLDASHAGRAPLADAAAAFPLVSIIVLAYRQEKYIREALAGIFAQTYPRLDIVILDDASDDATASIIEAELAPHAERSDVRFIRNQTNLGIRGNLLKGLALVRGDFIVQACGDDVMFPTMVERMVEVWRREGVSLVTVNSTYIDAASVPLNRLKRDPEAYDDTVETLARDGSNALCQGAAMGFERGLYEQFTWPPDYPTTLDILLPFYACLSKGARFIPEPLLHYRVSPQNTSLSLAAEASSGVDRLLIEQQIFQSHLTQAFMMESELDRLKDADPARYGEIARRLKPLVTVQVIEMARKLVRNRAEMWKLGVRSLAPKV
jgi:hypothetical protein